MNANASILTFVAAALVVQPVPAQAAPEKVTTRVFMAPQCLVTSARPEPNSPQFIGGLIAIVAPVLLGYAIDAVSADLQKIRKKESAGFLRYDLYDYDSTVARYPRWNDRQGCVTVITAAGDVSPSKLLQNVAATADTSPGASIEEIRRRLVDNDLTAGEIYSVFEAELVYSEDASAFRYVPRYYRLDKLLPGNRGRTQGVAYTLSLLGPGATPNGTQYNSVVLQVGQMSSPTLLDYRRSQDKDKLDGMASGYVQRPGMTPTSFASFLRRSREENAPPLKLMPAVLRAELVQTLKPSDVAKFAAAILTGAKPGLVAAAGKELTPTDASDERQKVLNAEVAVKAAQAELAAAQAENNPAKIALANAKLNAALDLQASLQ